MPHFRIDDALNSHPKARKAGLEAMGLWAVSGAFCQAYLTDGFVPGWYVKTWPKGTALAKRLIAAGLWLPAERDGENGWLFHEWLKVQDSKEQIEADREKWRKKKQAQRESRGESPRVSPGDKGGDKAGDSRESPGYTQPNPTQQEEISGYVPESASLSTARDSIAATPGADLVRELIPSTIPDSERTMLRIKASALLREGTNREDVSDALRLYLAKPHLGAGALPALASEVIRSRTAPPNGKTHKLRAVAELAAEARAEEEQAQLESANHRRALE